MKPPRPRLYPLLALFSALLLLSLGVAPATGPSHWTQVNGHPLHYLRYGSGTPVLLLHGGGDSGAHSFARQLDELVAAGHEVIAPDQVGQGETPALPGPLSYTAMMEDTAALLGQLDLGPVDAVGFSDGGILALMLAAHHPRLLRRLVVSGVNISPAGLPKSDLDDMREDSAAAADSDAPPTLADKLRELWLNAPTARELSPQLLAGIQQPVLVMAGDHDAVRLDHILAIFHALPHGELFIVPGTGHGTFRSRPDWVNPVLLNFLDRV